MTTLDLYKQVMALINSVENGNIDITDADYKALTVQYINIRQSALSRYSDIYKTYNVTKKQIYPAYSTMEVIEHNDEEIIITSNLPVKSYYFEVNGTGTAYIEESSDQINWTEVEQIDFITTSNTAYKKNINYTNNNTYVRIRYTGDYYYTITNIALYKEKFVTVPDYGPYTKYEMPNDFQSIDQIIKTDKNYKVSTDYYWENGKSLYLSNNFTGNMKIIYMPIPTKVTAIDENNILSVSDKIANTALVYGVASDLLIDEDIGRANYFEQKYQESLIEARRPKMSTYVEIEDVYGGI